VVASTRGEPLLWDGLPGLAAAAARRGFRLNVVTNGSFPGLGAEGWARVLCPVGSDVKISWGAADPEVDRRLLGGRDPGRAVADLRAFVRVRDAVAAAGGNRCGVSLQVAAREENVDGLADLVRMAAREGLDRVKVNQLQLHFPSLAASSLRRSPEGTARWNRAVTACREAAASTPRPDGGRVVLEGLVERAADGSPGPRGDCPFAGREAWVEADGRYLPCPAPAAREGRLPGLGSLDELTLGEAWRGPAWRRVGDGWRDLAPCADCPFRSPGGA
jgi:MoaA/NifB/PqqE/SkfB family radical SAM enzyme